MAFSCVFSRNITKLKFSFLYFNFKRFCSQATVSSEIRITSEETNSKVSTLFVPGRHGADVYQIVKPLIDIEYVVNNLEHIKHSCNHRGINLDLKYILKASKEWLKAKNDFTDVVEKDQQYVAEIHRLNLLSLTSKLEEVQKERENHSLTIEAEKEKLYDIEDVFMPLMGKIPHLLHHNTPLDFNVVDMCQDPTRPNVAVKSHLEIAKNMSTLYSNVSLSISYFMTGKLAELDLAIQTYFMDKLNNVGFFALNGVDFCKSFIIEAIGKDSYSNHDSILLKDKNSREISQKLHLVGSASFEILSAYFANMNVNKSTLPFKYFALGRRYNAHNKDSNLQDLFSVIQSTNIHGLILSETSASKDFDMLLEVVIEIYSELNIPYRIVNLSAKNLNITESRRTQLELWSPALEDYIPIAYVSQHDDFISKRLNISYGFQHEKEGYCHIVEGTIVNTPVLIGCIVENFQTKDDFNIPFVLEKYLFSK